MQNVGYMFYIKLNIKIKKIIFTKKKKIKYFSYNRIKKFNKIVIQM